MALHELAANAQQHGALSNDRGRIEISWQIDGGESDPQTFHFEWTEHNGPAVLGDAKPGFGSSILTTMTESALNAETTFEMRDHGIYWGVAVPIVTPGGAGQPKTGIQLGPSSS